MHESVRSLRDAVKVAYFEMRGDLINSYNESVSQEVEEESDLIRDMTEVIPLLNALNVGRRWHGEAKVVAGRAVLTTHSDSDKFHIIISLFY